MGQKTNPIGARLGIIRGWESNWYGSKKDYAFKLIEDNKIRTYLNARINKGGIAKIVIERTLNKLIVTIHTSKPGIIIGKGGGEVDRIKEELKKLTGKDDVQINILEIRRPELDANIVGDTIARQIENRINYKRAIKMAIASALRMGAEGIKIKVAGRLGGAEIARTEEIKQGRTPLHTLRMDIDYANVFALTVYGKIGIKVWICKGEVLAKRDLNPNFVGGKEGGGVGDRRDRRMETMVVVMIVVVVETVIVVAAAVVVVIAEVVETAAAIVVVEIADINPGRLILKKKQVISKIIQDVTTEKNKA